MAVVPYGNHHGHHQPDDHGEDFDDDMSDASSLVELDASDIPDYFQEINGRLFHSHGRSPYPMPVDADEQHRQNGLHSFSKTRLLGGRVYVGPVPEVLSANMARKVVDLGTGTGKWVMDMARDFPHVRFYGLDIVPIAPRMPPNNVYFEITDMMEGLRYANGSIDLVHARSIELATLDYRGLLAEVTRILRSGGLFIACEWVFYPVMCDRSDPRERAPLTCQFFDTVIQTIYGRRHLRPLVARIPSMIRDSGFFCDIQATTYPVFAMDGTMSTLLSLYAESMGVLLVGEGRDTREVNGLVQGYLSEIHSVPGMMVRYCTVHARKK